MCMTAHGLVSFSSGRGGSSGCSVTVTTDTDTTGRQGRHRNISRCGSRSEYACSARR